MNFLFAAFLLAASVGAEDFAPLRVLTYNINALPFGDPALHDRYGKVGAILAERRALGTAPQIVVIQEAFHSRSDELIQNSGYPHFRRGASWSEQKPFSSGLLILSEFPIESAETIDFAHCSGWDCLANKGVLRARLRLPGLEQPLEVYTTHMNSNSKNDPVLAGQARLRQVAQFIEFFAGGRSDSSAALFSGDFNFNPETRGLEYYAFASFPRMNNAAERCSLDADCLGTESGEIWRSSVDHHFYLNGAGNGTRFIPLAVQKTFTEPVDGGPLSDHAGLEVVYAVESPR